MKREKSYYNNFRIYIDRDSWITAWKSRIVKTRKIHHCYNCDTDIPISSEALLETGIDPDTGPVSAYTCSKCVDEYVEIKNEDK